MLLPLVGPGLPGTLLSSFLRFAQSILPAQAAGQRRWVTLCIHSLGGWASSFTTGMLEGTASCLASPGSHVASPPFTCPTKRDRPTPLRVLAGCPSSCHSGRCVPGLAAPCPLLGGWGVLEGAACCPPHWSPVATATGARGAGQVERAGSQDRDEKALHGRTKAVCEHGRLASGPCGQSEH